MNSVQKWRQFHHLVCTASVPHRVPHLLRPSPESLLSTLPQIISFLLFFVQFLFFSMGLPQGSVIAAFHMSDFGTDYGKLGRKSAHKSNVAIKLFLKVDGTATQVCIDLCCGPADDTSCTQQRDMHNKLSITMMAVISFVSAHPSSCKGWTVMCTLTASTPQMRCPALLNILTQLVCTYETERQWCVMVP